MPHSARPVPDSSGKSGDKSTPQPPVWQEELAEQLFIVAPSIELEGFTDEERTTLLDIAATLLTERPAGTHRIHAGAGHGKDGKRRMALALLTDNMPFLVDSVSAAMSAEGLEILRMIHPILHVRRDADGMLLSLGDRDAPQESLILLETRRVPARKRTAVVTRLENAYADVRHAVSDWQPTLAMLHGCSRALDNMPPPIAPHILAESTAFLDWLAADNFTFLGAGNGDTRLGILRDAARWPLPEETGPEEAEPEDPRHGGPILIRKSPLRATVHRGVPLDHIIVHQHDSEGRIRGATHFLGLFTSAALRGSPRHVPLLRRKVADVTDRLGYDPRSHDGRMLEHVIEVLPREELFLLSAEELVEMVKGLLSLQDRPRPAIFVRHDTRAGSATIFAYIPRDDYNALLRQRLASLIEAETGGVITGFDVELRADPLARAQFTVENMHHPADPHMLTQALAQLTRGWEDELELQLAEKTGAMQAARLGLSYAKSFGAGYRDEYSPAEGAEDLLRFAALESSDDRGVTLFRHPADGPNIIRMKIFRLHEIIPISDTVPILENFGFRVIEEVPWEVAGETTGWIHDFRLEIATPPTDIEQFCQLVRPALAAVLEGRQENDRFNALIPACRLTAEESNWIRAWFRYLRQTGISYGIDTIVDTARRNQPIMAALVGLFRARHAPPADEQAASAAEATLSTALDAVQGIDDDRILRLFHGVIRATLRTNAFAPAGTEALAFKFDSGLLPDLPKPLPWREIWVYSPLVEGIHLRGGPVARGGLRWSDRRDDFRTEVLGLLKAQMVKNSIIVPSGAKGGFYAKQLPDPHTDRDGWLAGGRDRYRMFVRALLSITDNLTPEGKVVPPADVTRLDDTDAYLVVAADKGTASFSDTANAIAEEAGFWLGDAFASGGSSGYDHKAMGITARGAWISVARHFAEMGVDVAKDNFTVTGVGDMSGDVFGNGMLRSQTLLLRAAFDHRHIFLDPTPDAATSFAERERLFHLPRSSWADYNADLLSAGGGVFPRTRKSIPLSAEVREMLGTTATHLDPTALIAAILRMQTDLLWFGGIGTYVKSAREANADVGDRANDAYRVNGEDLRARVVGEGANLGVTQAGRIEFALRGGRINADFIDNSAGVDTSDHEVNIKIALSAAEHMGKLERAERDTLLAGMTDEIAELVLADNVAQTLALSIAEIQAAAHLQAHGHLIDTLEAGGQLDRHIEGLPDQREIAERARTERGLTRPELAVLLSNVKMRLKKSLPHSALTSDKLLEPLLMHGFPQEMRTRFAGQIHAHPLRKEIVATRVANVLVNRGGLTLANDVVAELGCPLPVVAAAFIAARTLFDLPDLWHDIENADIPAKVALHLHAETATIARILVSDLARQGDIEEPAVLVSRMAPGLRRIIARLDELLRPQVRGHMEAARSRLLALGSPPGIADRIAMLTIISGAVGIIGLARELGTDEIATVEAYTCLGQALGIDWVRGITARLHPVDPWERLLVTTTVRSMETMRLELIRRLTPKGGNPLAAVEQWLDTHADRVRRTADTIASARAGGPPTLSMLAHLAGLAHATTLR